MAVSEIKKIEITANQEHKEAILELLQNQGVLQIIEKKEKNENPENRESLNQIEYQIAGIQFCLNFLNFFHTKKKQPLLDSLRGVEFYLTSEEVEKRVTPIPLKKIIQETQEAESLWHESKNKITKLETEIQKYQNWAELKIIPDPSSQETQLFLGEINSAQFETFQQSIKKEVPLTELVQINEVQGSTQFCLIFHSSVSEKILSFINPFDAKEVELDHTGKSIREIIKNNQNQIQKLKKEILSIEKKLTKLADSLPDLKIAFDYYQWKKNRELLKNDLYETKMTFHVQAWIPLSSIQNLEQEIKKITSQFVLETSTPSKKESVPVLLKNTPFLTPFEFITHLYGSPKYNEPDPSPFLAPFFIVFFGLCLTDAGYGFVLIALIISALIIFQIPRANQHLFKTLLWGGAFTVVAGALFGGWFGIPIQELPESPLKSFLIWIQIVDPMKDPLKILILSLGLGFFQVVVGLLIGMIWNLKNKNWIQAICDHGFWAGMLLSLLFWYLASVKILFASLDSIFLGFVIFFALGLVATQGRRASNPIGKLFSGILSLYNIVGYGSDILSYSRLLALGLSTGVVAMVVNIMGGLVSEMIPYVGWLIAILIFAGGHIFNLGINVLGAYIHSMRLQFVEFFPKFMEGGGDIFSPFKKQTRYVKLKHSNTE